jgi:hypothetical protein
MNVSYVVGHERSIILSFQYIVAILLVLTVFWYGCVKYVILYKGDGLRLTVRVIMGDGVHHRPGEE